MLFSSLSSSSVCDNYETVGGNHAQDKRLHFERLVVVILFISQTERVFCVKFVDVLGGLGGGRVRPRVGGGESGGGGRGDHVAGHRGRIHPRLHHRRQPQNQEEQNQNSPRIRRPLHFVSDSIFQQKYVKKLL